MAGNIIMTTLTDILAVHRPQHVLGKLQCSIDCQGRFATTDEWAAHVADAITAAGLAMQVSE